MEIWKDIKGYEGYYKVSDQGGVKSLDRIVPHKRHGLIERKGKILKPGINSRGYNTVRLYINGKGKSKKPYKLVAIAFLNHKPGEDGLVVDHIELPKTDDSLSNLQLTTIRENSSKDKWRKNYSSKYVGVSWCNTREKWRASITVNKKLKNLGYFDIEIEAHYIYQKALKEINKKTK